MRESSNVEASRNVAYLREIEEENRDRSKKIKVIFFICDHDGVNENGSDDDLEPESSRGARGSGHAASCAVVMEIGVNGSGHRLVDNPGERERMLAQQHWG